MKPRPPTRNFIRACCTQQNKSRVQSEPNGTQVEIIARALEPAEPYHGYRWMYAFACVGGAAAAGFVLTFLLEFVDHSLRGPDDVAEVLPDVPVLATLTEISAPVVHDAARARRRLIFRIAAGLLLAAVVSATLVEGFMPGKLGEAFVYVRQLTH